MLAKPASKSGPGSCAGNTRRSARSGEDMAATIVRSAAGLYRPSAGLMVALSLVVSAVLPLAVVVPRAAVLLLPVLAIEPVGVLGPPQRLHGDLLGLLARQPGGSEPADAGR